MKTINSPISYRTEVRSFTASSQIVRCAGLTAILPCLMLPLSADQFGDFTYTDNGTTITITDYPTTATGTVEIPATIIGKPVTEIGGNAFNRCGQITGVTIPGSVMSIGDYAFARCDALEGVAIPATVASIGDYAFNSCDELASVSITEGVATIGSNAFGYCDSLPVVAIPASVVSIGSNAFDGCSSLVAIAVAPANPNYSSTCGVLFDKAQTTLLRYPAGLPGAYALPDGVTSIADSAFRQSRDLTGITFPDGLTSIGISAFMHCTGLTEIAIPPGIAAISDWTFWGCTGLTDAALPDDLTSIGNYSFAYCSSLPSVTIPPQVATIGHGAFLGCSTLSEVMIPAAITSIGSSVFKYCTNLTAITVDVANPNYSSIDGVLFNKLQTSLVAFPIGRSGSYVIAAGVTQIDSTAFVRCSSLQTLNVDATNPNYSSLDGVLFNKQQTQLLQCPGARTGSYAIPSGVIRIRSEAFDGCPLTTISIPPGVTEIGDFAFGNCGLTSIELPDAAKNIGRGAFVNCGELGHVRLPATLGWIPDMMFSGCGKLTCITIPAGLSGIGPYGFGNCCMLSAVSFLGKAPVLQTDAFDNTAGDFTVYYFNGAAGFTSPTWNGYPAVNMGSPTPAVSWLLDHGYVFDADLESDPDHDGVNLLMAYALDLDPRGNPLAAMPKPVIVGNQMSITFYGGNTDVTCAIETSTDLRTWSTDEVTISAPDGNGFRTASVDKVSPVRFMRLAISR
jgi:hypothetical protein